MLRINKRLATTASAVSCVAAWLMMLCAASSRAADSAQMPPLVHQWLERQTNVQTWAAEVTQFRYLQALKQPLVSTGQVWYAAPNRFRWELGKPPQTIALRDRDVMTIVYPKLKRAERYAFDQTQKNQWRDLLKLLEAGFPQSAEQLNAQFTLLKVVGTNDIQELRLQPRSPGARKMMPEVGIVISTNDWSLRGTELQFADGSRMRNLFTNGQTNVTFGPDVFNVPIGPDYKVTEPLKNSR